MNASQAEKLIREITTSLGILKIKQTWLPDKSIQFEHHTFLHKEDEQGNYIGPKTDTQLLSELLDMNALNLPRDQLSFTFKLTQIFEKYIPIPVYVLSYNINYQSNE